MQGDQQIGIFLARNVDPLRKSQKLIGFPRQHSLYARLTVEPFGQFLGKGERNILLMCARLAALRTIINAAVASVDGNDELCGPCRLSGDGAVYRRGGYR
ncbi:hypothetical protein D3C80_1252430 [compost metagenome]